MKNSSPIYPDSDIPMPPFDYIKRVNLNSEETQIALHLPEPLQEPNLETLKNSDPDSYRMVVYTWA